MRFLVPQFIEMEDQIFGPLTFKQAIYLAGAGGVVLALFARLGFIWAILLGGPITLLALALAFYKVNNRSFMEVLYAWFFFTMHKKLYLWKKEEKTNKIQDKKGKEGVPLMKPKPITPKLSQSRLKELAWSLDTKESLYTKKEQWQ